MSQAEGQVLDRDLVDDSLYKTLLAIYHFERSIIERFGLDYRDIVLLQFLSRRPVTRVGQIAQALGLPFFTTTRLATRLGGLGYLARSRDPKDGRGVGIALTDSGRAVIRAVEDYDYEAVSKGSGGLSPERVRAFLDVSGILGDVLGVKDRMEKDQAPTES